MQIILKSELGDFLYIIIFVVIMFAGVIEKVMKAKRQQQAGVPPPQPHDDFEDVDEQASPSPPPTLEEVMRRMMQTIETPQQKEVKTVVHHPMGEHSQEDIPAFGRHFYHPDASKNKEQSFRIAPVEEEKIETSDLNEYYFDIRQAVIASEILNRKY